MTNEKESRGVIEKEIPNGIYNPIDNRLDAKVIYSCGYLEAIEKAEGLVDALEGLLENECCQDTLEEEHCGECDYCKGEKALAKWEKEK